MPTNVRIDWHMDGFEALRREPAVKALLMEHAEQIAAEAEAAHEAKGYLAVSGEGKSRSRAAVVTTTAHAINSNAKFHTLEKITAEKAI